MWFSFDQAHRLNSIAIMIASEQHVNYNLFFAVPPLQLFAALGSKALFHDE